MVSTISTAASAITDRVTKLKDTGVTLSGKTTVPAKGMSGRDERELVVDANSEGRYNLKLDKPDATYEIRDKQDNLILYGRNGNVLRQQGVYLSAGQYKVRVTSDNPNDTDPAYKIDLTPRGPDMATVVGKQGGKISGTTTGQGHRGMPSDSKMLRVETAGEYNIRINTPLTTFEVRNSRGEIVATGRNDMNPESVKVRLDSSDTYTVTTNQTIASAYGRAYDIDVAPRINATLTSNGGMVAGNMPSAPAGMSNKQSHTLNFVSDGDFSFNFLMPNAKFTVVDSAGKEIAKGENKPGEVGLPVDTSVKAGIYTLNIEMRAGAGDGGNWLLNVMKQKDKNEKPELTKVEKMLQERDQTLRDQAAGISKTTLTSATDWVRKAAEAYKNR